jgi:hypothetical protein
MDDEAAQHQIPLPPSRFGPPLTLDQVLPPIRPLVPNRKRHAAMAFTALVLVVSFAAVVIFKKGPPGSPIAHVKVGQCLDAATAADSTLINAKVIDCSKLHTREVYAIGTTSHFISLVPEPPDPELVRICRTEANPVILKTLRSIPDASVGFVVNTSRTGRIMCVVITAPRTGSYVNDDPKGA